MTLRAPEPLAAQHRLEGFDCGKPALNDWLLRHARQAQGSGSAKTFVVAEDELIANPTQLPGPTAFMLHDTYGFPLELTEEIAGERDTPTGPSLYVARPIRISNPVCLACLRWARCRLPDRPPTAPVPPRLMPSAPSKSESCVKLPPLILRMPTPEGAQPTCVHPLNVSEPPASS